MTDARMGTAPHAAADAGATTNARDTGASARVNEDAAARADRRVLRIGTRGSQLALWQARTVAAALHARGETTEIIVIKTTGDRLGEAPLAEAGGKRLFVREIEEALLRGEIDLAVHSAKDMPVAPADGLDIAAVLPREEPWDALVLPVRTRALHAQAGPATATLGGDADVSGTEGRPVTPVGAGSSGNQVAAGATDAAPSLAQVLAQLPANPVVGTSSVRRIAQLRRALPGARFEPIRGNLDTRLRKLDEGQYDLLVLATAGLKRLGAADRISARIPWDVCLPAPGQGAIAVQTRTDDDDVRARVAPIGDRVTALTLAAERALVDALGGGCQTPIAAYARPVSPNANAGSGAKPTDQGPTATATGATSAPDVPTPTAAETLELHALVISLDGQRALHASLTAPSTEATALGTRVAKQLLAQGAADILAQFSVFEN